MLYSVLILFQITPSFPFMKEPSFQIWTTYYMVSFLTLLLKLFPSLQITNYSLTVTNHCALWSFFGKYFSSQSSFPMVPSFYEWFVNGLTDDKIALQSPCCERKQSYVLDKICNSLMWKNVLQTPPNPSTTLNLFSQTWNDEWTDKYRPTSM